MCNRPYGLMQSHKNPHEEAHDFQQCSNSIITHFACVICCAPPVHTHTHYLKRTNDFTPTEILKYTVFHPERSEGLDVL